MVSRRCRNTSLGSGGCVGIVASCEEGPGRRPQSAKRQRFMELRARGWSVRAAAREVGVSRTAGTNWSRGYKTYRNGVVVGFVEPLDRLGVREVSSRYLSQDERIEICRPASVRAERAGDRRPTRSIAVDDLARASATAEPAAGISPSMLTGAPPTTGTTPPTMSRHQRRSRRGGH